MPPLRSRGQPAGVGQRHLIGRHPWPGDVAPDLIDIEGKPSIMQTVADMAMTGPASHELDRIALALQLVDDALECPGNMGRHMGHCPG
jgi:hypothetical protein